MNAIADNLEILNTVNRCQIDGLKKAGSELDPVKDSAAISVQLRNVQAAVIHTYQLTACAAIRESDPKIAALRWKEMVELCDAALSGIKEFDGTTDLYDLVLDYKREAEKRYSQNLQDSKCQTMPAGLFPQVT